MDVQSNSSTVEQVLALFRPAAYFGLQCCTVSALALVVYDWMITLSREVDLYWSRKTRPLAAILYFSNMYLNLLSCFVSTLQLISMSNEECARRMVAARLTLYLSLIPPAVFTTLRAYALTRSWWLSVLVGLLSAVQFVGNMVSLIWFHIFNLSSPTWGCVGGVLVLPSSALGQMRLIVNRVATILADIILVFVTWKCLPASALTTHRVMGLSSVMLRNGMLYFIVLTMLNVVQLILTVGFPVVPDGILFDVWFFTFPLSAVLVSHFLLDLQEAHQKIVVGLSTGDPSNISQNVDSIQFNAGALGSVGATVGLPTDPVQEEDECEEDEENHVGCDDHRTTTEPAHLDEGDP